MLLLNAWYCFVAYLQENVVFALATLSFVIFLLLWKKEAMVAFCVKRRELDQHVFVRGNAYGG